MPWTDSEYTWHTTSNHPKINAETSNILSIFWWVITASGHTDGHLLLRRFLFHWRAPFMHWMSVVFSYNSRRISKESNLLFWHVWCCSYQLRLIELYWAYKLIQWVACQQGMTRLQGVFEKNKFLSCTWYHREFSNNRPLTAENECSLTIWAKRGFYTYKYGKVCLRRHDLLSYRTDFFDRLASLWFGTVGNFLCFY